MQQAYKPSDGSRILAPAAFVGLFLFGLLFCSGYIYFASQWCAVPDAHEPNHGWLEKFFCEAKAADVALVYFTWCLAVATGWLGWATLRLWKAGERQIEVAAAAARAARDSADTAKQALTMRERAFVFAKEIEVREDRAASTMGAYQQIPGQLFQYSLSAVLENSGQTPATRMRLNFNCGYVAPANVGAFDFPDQGPARPSVLGPNSTMQTWSRTISFANIKSIAAGTDRWFIWGWADYDDVFENTPRHRTEFCFEVIVHENADGKVRVTFPMHDRFNATDDDCLRKPAPFS